MKKEYSSNVGFISNPKQASRLTSLSSRKTNKAYDIVIETTNID